MVPWFEGSKDFWVKAFAKGGLMYKDKCVAEEMVVQGVLRAMHEIKVAESEVGIALHMSRILSKNEVEFINKVTSENMIAKLVKNTMICIAPFLEPRFQILKLLQILGSQPH